jgi:hypothetical protein
VLRRSQVDALDPGTCLMWIFGSLLLLFWLMFAFYGDLFDRARALLRPQKSPCVLKHARGHRLQTRTVYIVKSGRTSSAIV